MRERSFLTERPKLADPRVKFAPETGTRLKEEGWRIEIIPEIISVPNLKKDYCSVGLSEEHGGMRFNAQKTLEIAWKPTLLQGSFPVIPLVRQVFGKPPQKSFEEQQLIVDRFSKQQNSGVKAVIPTAEQLLYLLHYYYRECEANKRPIDEIPFGRYSRTATVYQTPEGEIYHRIVGLGTDWGADFLTSEAGPWIENDDSYFIGVMPLLIPEIN